MYPAPRGSLQIHTGRGHAVQDKTERVVPVTTHRNTYSDAIENKVLEDALLTMMIELRIKILKGVWTEQNG